MKSKLTEARDNNGQIWSSDGQQEYYWGMDKDELIHEIESMGEVEDFIRIRGYDDIEEADEDELLSFLLPDDLDLDYEDFTESILPMIEEQCYGDILILSGQTSNWRGDWDAAAAIETSKFINYIYPNYDATTRIYSDNGNLYYVFSSHDVPTGSAPMYLYSFKDRNAYNKAEEMLGEDYYDMIDADYQMIQEWIKAGVATPVRNGFNESLDRKSIKEEDVKRYSDVYDDERKQKGWWYFTTHGVQPGSIPKGLNVLEVRDGQNKKGTKGTFIRLDGILNTSELDNFDMIELSPNGLKESYTERELIDAVQWHWGYSKAKAKEYIKTISNDRKQALVDTFKDNAKRSFLTDSLKEEKTPYGDTTIEDYVNDNFDGEQENRNKFVADIKKKATRNDGFSGLHMSVKDWEKLGREYSLSMKKSPVTESKELKEAKKWSNKYPQYQYGTEDGWTIIAPNPEEAEAKYDDIMANRYKGVRTVDEIDELASELYANEDRWSFNYFSDKELAMLWALCSSPGVGREYDDEVYDAIHNCPNASKIFKASEMYFNKFKRSGRITDSHEAMREDTEKNSKGKWVNRGKEGTHGEFRTKKEADAQRRAIFASGFKGQ